MKTAVIKDGTNSSLENEQSREELFEEYNLSMMS